MWQAGRGETGKNGEKFVTEAFCLLSFALVTDTRLPVKSSKHDVRGLIFSPFFFIYIYIYMYFLTSGSQSTQPGVPPFRQRCL